MQRRPPRSIAVAARVLACVLALGCAGAPGDRNTAVPGEISVVDADGRSVRLSAPAQRIVSLVPSATATLRALGATDALVGRTDYDDQPWAASLPSVGGGLEPSLEALVALEPDLVIRFAGGQDPRTPARLEDLGIPYLAVRPDRLEDVYETSRLLGEVTGHAAAGDSLARAIEEGLRETAGATAGWPRLRVAYVLGGTPPWVSGPGTYLSQVVDLVGGDNVFSDLDALYAGVSPEELIVREIDVVLLSGAADFDPSLTPGARIVDIGTALEIPGPSVVDAARRVAELMHGRSLR